MSWLKKIGDFCRKSNDRAMERGYSSSSSSYSSNSNECCATCAYWGGESPFSMTEYTCCKHNFKYDPYDVNHNRIHWKKKCSDYWRK